MSKLSIAVLTSLGALLFFGLGYRVGFVPPPPREYRPLPLRVPPEELTGASAEIRDALQIADPIERMVVLGTLLKGLDAGSIPAVRDGYESVFIDLGASELRMLAQWWARLDPRSAFSWAQESFPATSVLADVVRAWAARDPRAAACCDCRDGGHC